VTSPNSSTRLPTACSPWFRDGHRALLDTLRATASDQPSWAFLAGADKTASFWARRQAHETAIHRADAESACGSIPSFDPDFALDGIAELLEGFYGRRGGRLVADPGCTLRIAPSDADVSWLVAVRPDGREITRDGRGAADATVSGSSPDLYLHLWNREPTTPVAVDGDPAIPQLWKQRAVIEWS
jgi:uncharacterized protein (TIGR03083 family)